MRRFVILLCAVFMTFRCFAAGFEGIIDFTKTEGTTVEKSTWYVKGDSIRIDFFESGMSLLRCCYLVNTKTNSTIFVDHKAKTWSDYRVPNGSGLNNTTTATTGSKKEFHGEMSSEFQLMMNDSSRYSYWITDNQYGFFLAALNLTPVSNEFFYNYYKIRPAQISLPMMVQHFDARGKLMGSLEVTRFEKRTIPALLFSVPADYKMN